MIDIASSLRLAGVQDIALHTTLTKERFTAMRTAVCNKQYVINGKPGIVRISVDDSYYMSSSLNSFSRAELAFNLLIKEMVLSGEDVYTVDLYTLLAFIQDKEEVAAGAYDGIGNCTYLGVYGLGSTVDSSWMDKQSVAQFASWVINRNRRGGGFIFLSDLDMLTDTIDNPWPIYFRSYLLSHSIGLTVWATE